MAGFLSRTSNQPSRTTNKFWNFIDDGGDDAELLLYGELASEKPWWDEGDLVTPKQFRDELSALGERKNITVRINSPGGDVTAASAIYTALKENPANIIVKVDGIAASAASVVAMAGDQVLIPSTAYLMIHNPVTGLLGYFYADELEKKVNALHAVRDGIVNAYMAKTGKTKNAIQKLMDKETWLTGDQAVDKGFADAVMFQEVDPPLVNGSTMIINSVAYDLSRFRNVPESFSFGQLNHDHTMDYARMSNHKHTPAIKAGQPATVQTTTPAVVDKSKGEKQMDIKNGTDLKSQAPNVYDEVYAAGVAAERARLQAIDEIADSIAPEFLKENRYKDGITAEQLALQAMKSGKTNVGNGYLDKVRNDAGQANQVGGATPTNSGTEEILAVSEHVKGIAEKSIRRR